MKNALLVSFLFFFSFQMQAQVEFAPLGATWHFDYYSFVSVLGYEKIVSVADTVVLGKPSKKLELELVWKDVGIIPSTGVSHEIHFVHQDGDKIYHFNPGPPNYMDDFEIMLDFSLGAGDTLFYADGVNYFAVDSTGTIELNGEQLQAQFGKTWMDWSNGDTLTIVTEKFGPINNYLFLNITDYCLIDAPCRNFRCYEDDSFPLLQLSEEDCEYIYTSTSEVSKDGGMVLSPNPVSNYLQITFPQPARHASLRLFSAAGALLLERPLPAGATQEEISMDAFPAGLYFVQLFENGRLAGVKKFIKI